MDHFQYFPIKISCGYSLRYPQHMFLRTAEENVLYLSLNSHPICFTVTVVKDLDVLKY